jgi:UMP-CMP kinase
MLCAIRIRGVFAGDLLRAEQASGSPDGDLIRSYIKEGQIVPVEITVGLLAKAMEASGRSKFLIDGFPRNENNFEGWKRVMGNSVDVDGVLFYDVDDETRLGRLLERGKTSGRTDDNAGESRLWSSTHSSVCRLAGRDSAVFTATPPFTLTAPRPFAGADRTRRRAR